MKKLLEEASSRFSNGVAHNNYSDHDSISYLTMAPVAQVALLIMLNYVAQHIHVAINNSYFAVVM